MNKNPTRKILFIAVLSVLAVLMLVIAFVSMLYLLNRAFRPDINKTGGAVLVYEIDTNDLTEMQKKDLSAKVIRVLRKRVDPRGVANIVWRPLGDSRFEIQMPNAALDPYFPFASRRDDLKILRRMLKGAGILEFRILPTDGHPDSDSAKIKACIETLEAVGPKGAPDDEYMWFEIGNPSDWNAKDADGRHAIVGQIGDKHYVLASNKKDEVMLHTGQTNDWSLKSALPGQDRVERPSVVFQLDKQGGQRFANVTGGNLGRPMCILLDDVAISAPTVQSRIYTHGQITGKFTEMEVQNMVNILNAGRLPAPLVEPPLSIKIIPPADEITDNEVSNRM